MSHRTDRVGNLSSLYIALVDSRNGYQEALIDAEGRGMTPLLCEMLSLRDQNTAELKRHLTALGAVAEDDGSFMSTVHKTIMDVRSLFGGLDKSILPGLIDGEQRILGYYDEALKTSPLDTPEYSALMNQSQVLRSKISDWKRDIEKAA